MFSLKPQENHTCCSVQPKGKSPCPRCHIEAKGVLVNTLVSLLQEKTKESLFSLEGYHFCKTPSCSVVYFKDESILTQEDIKVTVGCKEGASPATVCYCFNWTKEKIQAQLKERGNCTALEDIKEKMKNLGCSCEILNPSGGCCLGDVGKTIDYLSDLTHANTHSHLP